MADNVNIENFLNELPSLISQARRQVFATNINVCEFWCRRLEYCLQFLIIFGRRIIDVGCENFDGIVSLLDIIVEEIQSLKQRFERILEENVTSELQQNICPTNSTESCWGRPRKDVVQSDVEDLFDIYRNWNDVAKCIGVSTKTLRRRRIQFGVHIPEKSGPRGYYSKISHADLCEVVQEVLNVLPNAGETYITGACRSRGIYVQRQRIREAINEVDPVSRALRKTLSIVRRAYHVKAPNSLW